MPKYLTKTSVRDPENAIRVKRTADIVGVSTSLVYKVISGERINEKVLAVYMELSEGENLLIEAVKKAVPFNN